MAQEKDDITPYMLQHLQELLEAAESYGWEPGKAYHAIWLQQLEQGRVSLSDEDHKMKYCRALAWHRVMATPQPMHLSPPLSELSASSTSPASPAIPHEVPENYPPPLSISQQSLGTRLVHRHLLRQLLPSARLPHVCYSSRGQSDGWYL